MKVRVLPRLQVENWSLYWKESLLTQTQCLDPVELELAADSATVGDLLSANAAALGWQPAASLHRLDGFTGPWERVLARGRELPPGLPLRDAVALPSIAGSVSSGAASAVTATGANLPSLVVVRVALKADGWKVSMRPVLTAAVSAHSC
ncbi:hypothetical protein Vafri_11174 [Volvox africanus]|nr:hypothetical protein Vafri_11174 [Volvox africanus]